jgi:hypothetical protein
LIITVSIYLWQNSPNFSLEIEQPVGLVPDITPRLWLFVQPPNLMTPVPNDLSPLLSQFIEINMSFCLSINFFLPPCKITPKQIILDAQEILALKC